MGGQRFEEDRVIKWHLIAFVLGMLLDLIIGDPHFLPHPVRLIGRLIGTLDRKLGIAAESKALGLAVQGDVKEETKGIAKECIESKSSAIPRTDLLGTMRRKYGCFMVIIVIVITGIVTFGIMFAGYAINPIAGCIIEAILTCYILAGRQLQRESMAVCTQLKKGNVEGARKAVSMIVGRDTSVLDEEGIAKAAVETVAENASDGVIVPMLYTALGGPVLGFIYKAINTMDSMVGYKNEKYIDFGRGAAKLDDIVNFIPARICAVLMIAAAFVCGLKSRFDSVTKRTVRRDQAAAEQGKNRDFSVYERVYSAQNALRIYKRDRNKGSGPNPAQCESVCAGALGIRLAGPTVYAGGVVEKPYLGDWTRPIEPEDIARANSLMMMTGMLCGVICIAVMLIFVFV